MVISQVTSLSFGVTVNSPSDEQTVEASVLQFLNVFSEFKDFIYRLNWPQLCLIMLNCAQFLLNCAQLIISGLSWAQLGKTGLNQAHSSSTGLNKAPLGSTWHQISSFRED